MKRISILFFLSVLTVFLFYGIYFFHEESLPIRTASQKDALKFLSKELPSEDLTPVDMSVQEKQYQDVDEADMVVYDEKNIYIIQAEKVLILNAKQQKIMKEIKMKETLPVELLQTNDKLIVFGVKTEQTQIEIDKGRKFPYHEFEFVMHIIEKNNWDEVRTIHFPDYSYLNASISNHQVNLVLMSSIIVNQETKQFIYPTVIDSKFGAKQLNAKELYVAKDGNPIPQLNLLCSIRLDKEEAVNLKGVLGVTGAVYMNSQYLALVSTLFHNKEEIVIYLYRLDKMQFLHQIKVDGFLSNQYSVYFYDQYVRVATTTYQNDKSENHLYNISTKNGKVLDHLSFSKGEYIHAIRFDKNICYISTYLNQDPLTLFDFTNPKKIKKSKMIQPKDIVEYIDFREDKIFTVGMVLDDNMSAVSLQFHLYHPTTLAQIASYTIQANQDTENPYIDTEIRYNGKALTKYKNYYLMPMQNGDLQTLLILDVTNEIKEYANLSLADYILRTIVIDDVLYAIGNQNVTVLDFVNKKQIKQIKL